MDKGTGSRKAWEYVDFELEIGEGGPRKYPVTVRSPAGEAHEEMKFPFAEWELENKLLKVENTLLRSGETRRRIPSQEEQPVQDFGRILLQALLVGEVRTRYAMSLLEARRQNKGLRVKLRIHPPDLARLPWEFLYDPDRDEYLSLSSKTPLVRYLDLQQPIEQLPVRPPLRILGMVCSPRDLPELDVGYEKQLVEGAIRGLRTSSLIEMTWLEGQTWSDLQEAMWGGPWHAFHFIGHGGFDEASQEGAIALADESGRKHLLGARNLARLLDDHYSLRLVVLNSCEGARSSVRDAFSSTATTLVRRGVPAVVAMQYEITDRAAIAFARVFYRAVANGLPVDAAVAAGRTAVSIDSALEWGTPVLYMRSPDGRVFDISVETRRTDLPDEILGHEEALRQYREDVESIWADRQLNRSEAGRLDDRVKELGLNVSDASTIEREVMGEPKEAILERQERPAEEHAVEKRTAKERYRKAVEETWADKHLSDVDAGQLRALASELSLSTDTLADIERVVMGGTIENILKHQEDAAHEEEREERLQELYNGAHELYEKQEWQAVVDVFAQIHREDPKYPDPEELLVSAHEALETAKKQVEDLRQYREVIESVWVDEKLDGGEVETLRDLADKLQLGPSQTGQIEREVMGETIEGILERQERRARLDELYARARRSHQNQEWQAVVDVFEQIHSEDPNYPDPERLLQSALEAQNRVRKEQDALRQYREAVKSTSKEGLSERRAQGLRDLANKLELSASAASRIEQEVMDDTKEAILERLEGLYDEARQLHRNREWQAVIDIFARINLEDANYPDPEGLLASAHEALEAARKEEESLRQYREVVESAWADGELDSREVERLRDLADKLDLSPSHTGEIERTVTGNTKEAILESQERAARERYRNLVEDAWADNHVGDADAEQLGALARELDLSMDTVVDIERDVMGDTKEAILERQEQVARQKEQLDELYARARQLHQGQDWQNVVDLFEQISEKDPTYPDQERLLASAREALEIAQKKENALRQYREGVESAWTSGELDKRQAEQLRNHADELGLDSIAAADIEREVMSDTIEEILERHEQAAREERRNHLDGLYSRARELHRDQEWQAVINIFAEIHAEDSAYPDPEELLQSARNALERAQKEQASIRQYREAVEWALADEDLDRREVKRLTDLANRLELSPNAAAGIEREVMGETKEAILDRREQASAEHYRTAVEEASTDNELSDAEATWLSNLASELGLGTDTAADIEREVTGDTIPAILQRQRRLDELYVQARQLHQGQEWQAVVDVFEQIHSEDPGFSDPEGLLASAREALDQLRKVAELYDQALRYVDGRVWQRALECLEEVQSLEPGYRDTEEVLSRVRREFAQSPTAKIPDLSGQKVSQANRALTSKGLRLGTQREAPSDTVPEGQIIEQSLEASTEVEVGSSVSVTVSSGPPTVAVPDLVGKSRAEAESILRAAGLELGKIVKVSGDHLPEGQVVQQHPATGSKVERGISVRVTVAQRSVEEPKTHKPTKRPLSSRPDSLPKEPEPSQQGRLADHPGESTLPSVGTERSTIERYREKVEDYYKKGRDMTQVEVRNRLRRFAREWGISQDHADSIEREVTGDSKEAVREQMHQTESVPSSGRSEELPSQHGRTLKRPTDLPN